MTTRAAVDTDVVCRVDDGGHIDGVLLTILEVGGFF